MRYFISTAGMMEHLRVLCIGASSAVLFTVLFHFSARPMQASIPTGPNLQTRAVLVASAIKPTP